MKQILAGLLVMGSLSVMAQSREITLQEKKAACKLIQKIAPADSLSLKECMTEFQFDILSESSGLIEIEALGQTVEDMATVCTIYLSKDSSKVPNSYCTLE